MWVVWWGLHELDLLRYLWLTWDLENLKARSNPWALSNCPGDIVPEYVLCCGRSHHPAGGTTATGECYCHEGTGFVWNSVWVNYKTFTLVQEPSIFHYAFKNLPWPISKSCDTWRRSLFFLFFFLAKLLTRWKQTVGPKLSPITRPPVQGLESILIVT